MKRIRRGLVKSAFPVISMAPDDMDTVYKFDRLLRDTDSPEGIREMSWEEEEAEEFEDWCGGVRRLVRYRAADAPEVREVDSERQRKLTQQLKVTRTGISFIPDRLEHEPLDESARDELIEKYGYSYTTHRHPQKYCRCYRCGSSVYKYEEILTPRVKISV